jgi:hypothetical protein
MSLPARQQSALDRIEKALLADDPRFGSLFAIFTRLMWHEAIPGIELVKSGRWHSLRPFAAIAIALIALASVLMVTFLTPRRPICLTSPAAGRSYSSGQTADGVPGVVVMQERQYIHRDALFVKRPGQACQCPGAGRAILLRLHIPAGHRLPRRVPRAQAPRSSD